VVMKVVVMKVVVMKVVVMKGRLLDLDEESPLNK
jgi:hypothetical protein